MGEEWAPSNDFFMRMFVLCEHPSLCKHLQINMPPKKKEKGGKGGKGGKGSGAVPNAFDEPPQPAHGSPHCLSLSLEVSFLVDPCTAETGQSGGGDGEDINPSEQQIHQVLVEPCFRYTFVNGERITTPPVGFPGSSWTKLSPVANGDAALEAEQSTTAAAEAPGAADTGGELEYNKGLPEPVVWRYTRTHQLLGADEDEVSLVYVVVGTNLMIRCYLCIDYDCPSYSLVALSGVWK